MDKDYSNHIHITGPARTGTTLMKNLMRCFHGVHVVLGETDPAAFHSKNLVVVTKKPGGGINLYKNYPELNVICMIRDPRDMYCSTREDRKDHQYQWWIDNERRNPGGFASNVEGYLDTINHSKTCVIKYERLVSEPDIVQLEIAERFGLSVSIPFSQFHTITPDDRIDHINSAMNGIRPPDTNSIGRWRSERYISVVREWLRDNPGIQDFIRELGYDE